MKNTLKIIGIIAIIAVIGFSMVACATSGGGGGNNLVNSEGEIWGASSMGGNRGFIFNADGTYVRVGGMGGEHWESGGGGNYIIDGNSLTLTCEFGEAPETFTFAVSGDVLSLSFEYDSTDFIKMKVNLGGN